MKERECLYIVKRNGQQVPFAPDKIRKAISRANAEETREENKLTLTDIEEIVETVSSACYKASHIMTVEEIQDIVEREICRRAYPVFLLYHDYRLQHREKREGNEFDRKIAGVLEYQRLSDGSVAVKNDDVRTENANKDATIAPTQRDYVAGEYSRYYANKYLLPEDIVRAHQEGLIHFHDADFFMSHIYNCCLINLEDMLQNGTVLSGVYIDKPQSLLTACTITTQISAQVAAHQYGGQTYSLAHLAPFVDVSRQKLRKQIREDQPFIADSEVKRIAERQLKREIKAAVQTLQYQESTLSSCNGQAPFVSVAMYIDEVPEGRTRDDFVMLIAEMLKQRAKGVKNANGVWTPPTFPKLLYFLDEDNCKEGTKYWWLTKLAAECVAHAMVPDFISVKKEKEYKHSKKAFPCMGCVAGEHVVSYRLFGTEYTESFAKMWARCSKFFVPVRQPHSKDMLMNLSNVEIWDSVEGKFVECKKLIRNLSSDWLAIKFDHGRRLTVTADHPFETLNRGVVHARDLRTDDLIPVDRQSSFISGDRMISPAAAYAYGKMFVSSTESLFFASQPIDKRTIPEAVFHWNTEGRASFLAGVTDFAGCIDSENELWVPVSNIEAAEQLTALYQNAGCYVSLHMVSEKGVTLLHVVLSAGNRVQKHLRVIKYEGSTKHEDCSVTHMVHSTALKREAYSYDVTTVSEHFTVGNIYSHNCRSFLSTDDFSDQVGNIANAENFVPGEEKYYGRFNMGVVTLNLIDVALSSAGDKDKFWSILADRLELCHRALRLRYERLLGTPSDIAPVLWQYGAIARLKPGEPIDKLLHSGYSTISLGYAGLAETVQYMTGKSHSTPEGMEFGLAVMQALDDACDKWKAEEDISYSVYGTPLESTTYKLAKCLRRRFGVIPGITDHDYVTNSYHISVRQPIDAFTKLDVEGVFQKLSQGGCLSYVELPNMLKNIPAILEVIKHIYNHTMYAEINLRLDHCDSCGYHGKLEIIKDDSGRLIFRCPQCGCTDQHLVRPLMRICGYLSDKVANNGRMSDIQDRVLHL